MQVLYAAQFLQETPQAYVHGVGWATGGTMGVLTGATMGVWTGVLIGVLTGGFFGCGVGLVFGLAVGLVGLAVGLRFAAAAVVIMIIMIDKNNRKAMTVLTEERDWMVFMAFRNEIL